MVAHGKFTPALLPVILPHSDFHGDLFRCSVYNYSFQELHPQPLLRESLLLCVVKSILYLLTYFGETFSCLS